jgi:4'-phosphopantetheinyl transferase
MNLNPEEIHIWSATIDERYEKLLANSYLSVNENRNAKKFSYDIDSFLFTVRHNLLRIILGEYLSCHPSKPKFNSNHYQKPHITHPKTNIQFNISACSNRFVAVFCQRHSIGIDIELIRKIDDIKQLTSDYFTSNETEWVFSHHELLLETAFFNIWSKKEALAKAIGKGLSIGINHFDMLTENPIAYGGNDWYITQLVLFENITGAIAINNNSTQLSYFNAADLL